MNNGEVGGSRGRGRGLYQPEKRIRDLRQPKYLNEETKVITSISPQPPKSTLSADAKEWYPPNYVRQAPVAYPTEPYRVQRFSSTQDRIRQAQELDTYNLYEMSNSIEETENIDLRRNIASLITVMCEITVDPGKFDTLCGPLVDSFISTLNDVDYTQPLVEAIVNQSIAEANFRYNGARLCSMYDSVVPQEDSTFRACLLERCWTEENKIISGIETSEENIRGFAMFLAEIYTQLEDNQRGRIRSLGESLCKVLLHLLDTDKEVNIKAVCQLLKLSGIALDADCPAGMHAAFERLKERSQLACVQRVLELRTARWGLAEHEPEERRAPADARRRADAPAPAQTNSETGGLVGGYLADGQSLTTEECNFLQSNLPNKPASLDDDILEELENEAWDTGMDLEMQDAYLEFLKISNQIKR